jgi:hypothetical protein
MKNEQKKKMLPKGIGKYSTDIDIALSNKYTRTLYNSLCKEETSILVQLYTGMAQIKQILTSDWENRHKFIHVWLDRRNS